MIYWRVGTWTVSSYSCMVCSGWS